MNVLTTVTFLFTTAFFVHILFERFSIKTITIGKIKNIFLLIFFILTPPLYYYFEISPVQLAHTALFYFILRTVYLMTYLTTIYFGPSFYIIEFIKKNNKTGSTKEELILRLNNLALIDQRFSDLIKDKCLQLTKNNINITKKGVFTCWFFLFYKKIIGLKGPGG